MGISYVDFVKDPAIALLFRQAVLSALAINELPLSSVQIAYFYGQVSQSRGRKRGEERRGEKGVGEGCSQSSGTFYDPGNEIN